MRLLYVVFIISMAALLWAAYAIARAVRTYDRAAQASTLSLRSNDTRRTKADHEADPDEQANRADT